MKYAAALNAITLNVTATMTVLRGLQVVLPDVGTELNLFTPLAAVERYIPRIEARRTKQTPAAPPSGEPRANGQVARKRRKTGTRKPDALAHAQALRDQKKELKEVASLVNRKYQTDYSADSVGKAINLAKRHRTN